jgi:hypothetical protein
MGALIEAAGKSTTANLVPGIPKPLRRKKFQNRRSGVQEMSYQYVSGQIVNAAASVES